jgi:hypothetical protein
MALTLEFLEFTESFNFDCLQKDSLLMLHKIGGLASSDQTFD